MNTLALILFVALAVLALAQFVPALCFLRLLYRGKPPRLPDEACPKAAVILPLRGSDPFLADCLAGLLAQDYPNFDVRIVIDGRDDPAWQIVQDFIRLCAPANVTVEPLKQRIGTCGPKCSSLLQAIEGLDSSHEVVAFLDADAVPHPNWLRDLVTPLRDPKVAAASGQRWYMPREISLGALVRYVWNAANMAAMATNSVWGGSFAIKTRVLRESDLLEKWRESLAEDVLVYGAIQRAGYSMAFVPSAIMVNRETCRVSGFFRWVQRQVLLGRLYHFAWPLMLAHGLLTTLILAAATVTLPVSAANSDWTSAVWLGGGLIGYGAAMSLLVWLMERGVRHVVRHENQPIGWFSRAALFKSVLAIPLTQIVYAGALLKATFIRRVEWRGVWYRIDGRRQIRLVEYTPFVPAAQPAESAASV